MAVVRNTLLAPDGSPLKDAHVTVALKLGGSDAPGYLSALSATIWGPYSTYTDAQGEWSVELTPNDAIDPDNTYYVVSERHREYATSSTFLVPAGDEPEGGHWLKDVLAVAPEAGPQPAVYLSTTPPLALGASALTGTGVTGARADHVHPTTGLALAAHLHTGVYDPAGSAAAVSAALGVHEAAGNPHAQYLTQAEGDAAYDALGAAAAVSSALGTHAALTAGVHGIANTALLLTAGATLPLQLGAAAAGASLEGARVDHVHPTTGLGLLAAAQTWALAQTFSGQILAADGSNGSEGIGFTSGGGFYKSSGQIIVSRGTVPMMLWDSTPRVAMRSDASFGWSSTTTINATPDLILVRDAANTLAQRNGANAQTFNLYDGYTDGSNYKRLKLWFNSGIATLLHESAGTGGSGSMRVWNAIGALEFATNNSRRLSINTTGHVYPEGNGTQDLGISGQPWRNIYAGTQFLGGDGTNSAPTYSYAGATGIGWRNNLGQLAGVHSGGVRAQVVSTGIQVETLYLGFNTSTPLIADAAGVAALRNSTNPMELRISETHTDASNNSRLRVQAQAAGDYRIFPEANGTGTLRGLQLGASGGRLGFFGTTAIAKPTLAADATDEASAITLANSIKAALVGLGLAA